jgi:L,D-transpeptidase ErfK/SrfK
MPVHIVNQSIKVGWSEDRLYIEVHPSLMEKDSYRDRLDIALNLIEKANGDRMPVVNGKALKHALNVSNGIPVSISERNKTL